MKRSFGVRIAAAGAAVSTVLTACSSSGGSGGSGGSGSSGKTLQLGMAVANISLNFASEMVDGAKQAAQLGPEGLPVQPRGLIGRRGRQHRRCRWRRNLRRRH